MESQAQQQQTAEQRQQEQEASVDALQGQGTTLNNVANALTAFLIGLQKNKASHEAEEGDLGSSSESSAERARLESIERNGQRDPQGRMTVDETVNSLLAPNSGLAGQPAVDASINALLASNEVTRNPASTNQPSVDSSMSDLLGSESTQAAREKAADAQKELTDLASKFMVQAAKEWKGVKEFKEVTEPLSLAADSLSTAAAAYEGDEPTTIPGLKPLEVYLSKQNEALSIYEKRSVYDWEVASGVDWYRPSTTKPAQSYLDYWYQRLTALQHLCEPLAAAAQRLQPILENDNINRVRMLGGGLNTLPTGDSMFIWNFIIPELNGCIRKTGTIKTNIYDARSVVQ